MTHNRNNEEQQIHDKYVVKSMKYHMQFTREESEAYSLAWTHAMEYFNEIVNLHNSQMVAQMSDAEFKHYLEKRLEQ